MEGLRETVTKLKNGQKIAIGPFSKSSAGRRWSGSEIGRLSQVIDGEREIC